jgi:hypothetical protein
MAKALKGRQRPLDQGKDWIGPRGEGFELVTNSDFVDSQRLNWEAPIKFVKDSNDIYIVSMYSILA